MTDKVGDVDARGTSCRPHCEFSSVCHSFFISLSYHSHFLGKPPDVCTAPAPARGTSLLLTAHPRSQIPVLTPKGILQKFFQSVSRALKLHKTT
eukprot:410667-Rhodomonas_salina.3